MNLCVKGATDELFDLSEEDKTNSGHDDITAVKAVKTVDSGGPE